ncbi:DNA repair protein RadA [Myxococcota bacterium]|nr:DNA repair protein RadA [Myxococcota bacterium]
MARAKAAKTVFRCNACGHESPKWLGRCPGCGAWNSLGEERAEAAAKGTNDKRTFRLPAEEKAEAARAPMPLSALAASTVERMPTGIGELDRVLGGGLVPGALVLVGGDPGIGKSTLLIHALDRVVDTLGRRDPDARALYVTGEESPEQVKLRADRLGISGDRLLLFAETRTDRIVAAIEASSPAALVIDSIQAIYDPELESAPGSVAQIREVAARFLYLAKAKNLPTFLVGHVTKDGAIAGPRVLEHMVDTVLYFESSTGHPYRILRAHKNRFGSTNEIGVFEMQGHGLAEVSNPSELFLAERPVDAPGSVVLPALEGSRPVLVEVQALVTPTNNNMPRRQCLGFDPARASVIAAILEQKLGLSLSSCDAYVNVAGGMQIEEPAADLAIAVALASSLTRCAVQARTIVFGELGLAGELRAVTQPDVRLAEAAKLGFERAVVPEATAKRLSAKPKLELVGARTIETALAACLPGIDLQVTRPRPQSRR